MDLLNCLYAFIGSFGFSLVFRIHHNIRFSLIGATIGALGWATYLLSYSLNNMITQTFMAMVVVTFLAEVNARIHKAPATIFILVGCFPLVPGKYIYESMYYMVYGQPELFSSAISSTFLISGSIAFAILIVSSVFKMQKTIMLKLKK